MSIPRNNHYIPQVYLRHFAERHGKKFFFKVFDKERNIQYVRHVKDVCVAKDFYNWIDYEGTVRTEIENSYGIYESGVPQTYSLIHSNKVQITLNEKFHLLHCFHSLVYRNTNTSDTVQEMSQELDKWGSEVPPDAEIIPVTIKDSEGNEYQSKAKSMNEFVRVGKAQLQQALLENRMRDCVNLCLTKMDRIIEIVKVGSNPCLLSSDNPFSVYPLLQKDKKVENVILFPVDSCHVIMFREPTLKDHPFYLYRNRITLDANIINQEQYKNAKQIIYGLGDVVDLFLQNLKIPATAISK